jgi:hypothetical protein
MRPKQGGGVRRELLRDLFTGTVLQALADALADRYEKGAPSSAYGVFDLPEGSLNAYAAWGSTAAGWVKQELGRGRVVLLLDFAAYFPSVQPEHIARTFTEAGFARNVGDATLTLFERINGAAAELCRSADGLPIIPDQIVWILSDRILTPFDREVLQISPVRSYVRWVDDCFVSATLATRTK